MRRLVVVLGLMMTVAAGLLAQESMLNDRSFGVLKNELDRAQEPQPDFGSLQGVYLFGLLDNPLLLTGTSGATNYPWLGFYSSGILPASVIFQLQHTSPGSTATGSTTTVTATTKTIPTTGTAPDQADLVVDWISNTATKTFNRPVWFTAVNDQFHTLVNLSALEVPLVAGLNFQYYLSETDTGNNYTLVTTDFVDANSADNTASPDPTKVREGTNTLTGLQATTSYYVAIPIALASDGLKHRATLSGDWWWADHSTSRVDTGLKPVVISTILLPGTESWVEHNDAIKDIYGASQYGLSYELSPDLPKDAPNALDWTLGASGSLLFPDHSYSISTDQNTLTQTNVGDATTKTGNRVTDATTYTLANQFHASIALSGSAGFKVPLAPTLTWSAKPAFSLAWDNTGDSDTTISQTVRVEKTDQNGNDDFTDLSDEVKTTTTTYTDAAIDSTSGTPTLGGAVTSSLLGLTFEFPAAIEFKPQGWPFNFVVAAQARLGVSWRSTKTKGYSSTSVEVTETGDGTVANSLTTTTNTTADVDSATDRLYWTNSAQMSFLTRMDLGENVKLDIGLNGNLLTFESLKLQFTIALPAPKAEAEKPAEVAPVVVAPAPAPAPVAAPAGPPAGVPAGVNVPPSSTKAPTPTPAPTPTTTPPKRP